MNAAAQPGVVASGCQVPSRISVVIVSYNTRQHLAVCLSNLRAKCDLESDSGLGDPTRLEAIVVDNASTDGSADMVANEFPWVRLLAPGSNLGFAAATNLGIQHSSAEYVLLLNSDAVILPSDLERLIEHARNREAAGIIGPRLVNPDGTFQAAKSDFPTVLSVLLSTWDLLQVITRNPYLPSLPPSSCIESSRCDWLGGACLLARREAIDQVGLLDEGFFMNCEEMDWCRRMHQHGWKVWYCADVSVTHIGGGSAGRRTAQQRQRAYRSMIYYVRKHHGLQASHLVAANYRFASLCKSLLYWLTGTLTRSEDHLQQASAHWTVARSL